MRGSRTCLCWCLRGTSVDPFLDGRSLRTSFYLPTRCVLPAHRECTIYPCRGYKALNTLHCGYHFIGGLVYICKNKPDKSIRKRICIVFPIPSSLMVSRKWQCIFPPLRSFLFGNLSSFRVVLGESSQKSRCLVFSELWNYFLVVCNSSYPKSYPSVRVSRSNADLVLSFIPSSSYNVCLSHFDCFLGLGW